MDRDLMEWLQEVAAEVPAISALLQRSESNQLEEGYYHTLREICQQPLTWNETASRLVKQQAALRRLVGNLAGEEMVKAVVLTGSGSSFFAGESLAPALQTELNVPAWCITGGSILIHGNDAIPPCRPCLMISIARSGDSPESCAAVEILLQSDEQCRHLLVTCNERGKLATSFLNHPRVLPVILHDRTCDRSLVMTSSFTNMVLATRYLGMLERPESYREIVDLLGRSARQLILRYTQGLSEIACEDFQFAVYLGSGCHFGAAREAALKMMEMSAGRVKTIAETYLGLRHGPMAVILPGTLVVCILSAKNPARAYELDLIRELDLKKLQARKIIVGEGIPDELVKQGDLAVECPGFNRLGDANSPVIGVLAGQILALFRCLAEGLHPDAPSAAGVINRVVEPFKVYGWDTRGRTLSMSK